MQDYILEVKNVTKSFKIDRQTQKQVLKGINFSLSQSEIVTIMGPSGGGKSTFLKIVAGIVKPDEGDVLFNGKSIYSHHSDYTSHIGFIFQDYKLIPHLNAFENVALALRLRGISDWKKKAMDALEFTQTTSLAKSYPSYLSGGESQRIGIARAIAIHPSIIFADEPTGNLDKKIASDVINVFKEIKKTFNTSFVVVTHDPFMTQHADRTCYMHHGLLLESDPNEN